MVWQLIHAVNGSFRLFLTIIVWNGDRYAGRCPNVMPELELTVRLLNRSIFIRYRATGFNKGKL